MIEITEVEKIIICKIRTEKSGNIPIRNKAPKINVITGDRKRNTFHQNPVKDPVLNNAKRGSDIVMNIPPINAQISLNEMIESNMISETSGLIT